MDIDKTTERKLRRHYELIHYYESLRENHELYSKNNRDVMKPGLREAKLRILVAETKTMISSGVTYDAEKLPTSVMEVT